MGHERVGRLPRSARWINVIESLTAAAADDRATIKVANATLQNVRHRLDRIERDGGVVAAVEYLVALAHAASGRPSAAVKVPALEAHPSPARLVQGLSSWVDANRDSLEYAEIAKQAAADTIGRWSNPHLRQKDLFPDDIDMRHRWQQASTGGGFSELARHFFASFTERYLRYFLDREASAAIGSLQARQRFELNLANQVDAVAKHAFETGRITQSFAAGWYNLYARDEVPSSRRLKGFLRLAFQKIREELAREATAA